VLDGLARGLLAAGHDVLLFATGDSTCPVPRAWALSTAAGTADATVQTEISHVVRAYERVLPWRPDVVHDHTMIGPLHAERMGVPVITTNHGPFDDAHRDLYRAVSPRVGVIAISQNQADGSGGIPVLAVIHHGIDADAFTFGAGDGGYALFLGRMTPDKGADVAARVARQAGVPLRIAGKLREPDELEFFHRSVEPLLGDGVDYVGEVDAARRRTLLADAMCLLNPLRWDEPFGMVMIEALASGTPVLATRRGSVPEIVEPDVTGFIADDPGELLRLLGKVGDIERARCRSAALDRFSIERMTEDHLLAYRRFVERRALNLDGARRPVRPPTSRTTRAGRARSGGSTRGRSRRPGPAGPP
jgi:glycosyltransferase involved in cell wall biosynthesis